EDLVLHLAPIDGFGVLQKTVGQGGFTVVDVGDYREIADILDLHVDPSYQK
ncbi:MAG: hypothetical protein QG633_497, partial [Patescibacteria group bacterium]|nr:hypothetical protein [Patescibacteria group bacterium]